MTASGWRDDVRALGWGLPGRAVYEGARRLGGHRLLFERLARQHAQGRPAPPWSHVLPPPSAASIPTAARARVVQEATSVADGRLRLFGRVIEFDGTPDWHAVIDAPGHWPIEPWWTIDLRGPQRPGDVKWTWELGRHRHLVWLARAAYLDPDESRWAEVLTTHLRSWLQANPPEVGVHWASNLELTLRSFAWLQVLALAGDALPPDLVTEMRRVLWHTGHHLLAELPYAASTMTNNHLLGDALGLVLLGAAFDHPQARRWSRWGDRTFRRQVRREFRDDGSTIEEALSYHRFVMEMLLARALVDDAARTAVGPGLARAAQFLARLGVLDGAVPAFGDGDEGRVLTAAGDPSDLRGTTNAALAVAGTGASDDARERYDEACWYAPAGNAFTPEPAVRAGVVGGGIARAADGDLCVWLRTGVRPWHGHADLCSTEISVSDRWLVGDPGTGSYNRSDEERDAFRTSQAHAVVRVDGLDQLEPHRTFRWRHRSDGRLAEPLVIDGTTVLFATHDAYGRLEPSRMVGRVVIVEADGAAVTVADFVDPSGANWELDIPLGPTCRWQARTERSGVVELDGATPWTMWLPAPARARIGEPDPLRGWWSESYGSLEPSTVLSMHGGGHEPIVWGLVRGDEPRDPDWEVAGGSLLGLRTGIRVTVEWAGTVGRLRIGQGERQWVAHATIRSGQDKPVGDVSADSSR